MSTEAKRISAVILAAGKGTRMNSELPKVLHQLAGKSLIRHCTDTISKLITEKPVLIVGHKAEDIKAEMGSDAIYALQAEQLGTGHAVMMAEEAVPAETDLVLVTYGDMPLLQPETLGALIDLQMVHDGPFSMLTMIADDPRGFGRIVRGTDGHVSAIVEEAQATAAQKNINELNIGAYCFQAGWLWKALKKIKVSPKGEYYLTDVVEIAVQDNLAVQAVPVKDQREAIGINTRIHLSETEAYLRESINHKWMLSGVTMIDPSSIYIDADVKIEKNTTLFPNTILKGKTRIGENCRIGPGTYLEDASIGNDCKVFYSVVEQAKMENKVEIGPFAHLRNNAHLAEGVHMGNFGEVKNSYLGPGVKMGHFSYMGDAHIGENVNIGAGTITCNYDGKNKNKTEVGANAFIGSDTMLVAPLKIGENAQTGAGSVVTKDVPDGTIVVGVPAKPFKKEKK